MNSVQCILCAIILWHMPAAATKQLKEDKESSMNHSEQKKTDIKHRVQKHVLENGMTVLVMEDSSQPKVSIQVFYHVGSKDENMGEKGIAHLIEHMIFKGTNEKFLHLSESDINAAIQKLSGTTNAFTSYDYTGYLFNLPSTQWVDVFPIIADCMLNAEFDDQKLNSEMKAVIQELKMYRDSYTRELITELLSTMFLHHPYHYPIIGYKEDLWSVNGNDLHNFYQKHYLPNNATLIVVGDVRYDDVVNEAEKTFGHLEARPGYKKTTFHHPDDIVKKSITMYRQIQQPIVIFAFSTPGFSKKREIGPELAAWILAEKRHCRLYKKLVHDLQIATAIDASHLSLFDHTLFYIACHPKSIEDIPHIERVVAETLQEIASVGISDDEIKRAVKNYKMRRSETLDDFEEQAYEIGRSFLGAGDAEYILNLLEEKSDEDLKKEVHEFIANWLRPSVMSTGILLPIADSEKERLQRLQQEADKADTHILAQRIRTTEVEPPRYAEQITPKTPIPFIFPKPQEQKLSNGLEVLVYEKQSMERITIALQLKAWGSFYEPDDKPGLYQFMASLLSEGTKQYDAEQLAEFLEMRGMSVEIRPGKIIVECLAEDIESALIILKELVGAPEFKKKSIEKIRYQMLNTLKGFWDNHQKFSTLLFEEILYKGHPWGKNTLGTEKSLAEISRADLVKFYKKVMSPDGARLAVVGAVSAEKVFDLVKAHLDSWKHVPVQQITYPALEKSKAQVIDHHIQRDQVVLMLGNISVDRQHPDYEKLLIFDQIFGGGVLGSMMSRLFQLREATGLFYTITGSLASGADEQPGKFVVKTIVSRDHLDEAIQAIKNTIDEATSTITDEEIEDAKRAILYAQIDLCNTSNTIASMLLTLHKLQLPYDYYDTRYQRFASITKEDVIHAVEEHLDSNSLVVLKVGRI